MARADLLVALVRAARRGDEMLIQRTVEALIAEERGKQHNVLADRLEESLRANGSRGPRFSSPVTASSSPDAGDMLYERDPRRRLDDLVLPDVVADSVK